MNPWNEPARIETARRCAALAIIAGNHIAEIKVSRWAETYGLTEDQIRSAWDHELTKASLTPCGEPEE